MIFSIDADLLYSRTCKAKLVWKQHLANEDVLIRYPNSMKIYIPDKYILSVINYIQHPNQLLDWHYLGEITAQIYQDNIEAKGLYDDIYQGNFVHPEFSGLGWEIMRYEEMWHYDDIKASYDSLEYDEFDYPDGLPTLQDFKDEYIKDRCCQIIYSWISTKIDRIPDPRFSKPRHQGSWASGAWYPDDFTLLGAINIRELDLVEKKTNKIYKATIENIKKHLKDEIDDEEYFHSTFEIDIEDRLDQETSLVLPQNQLLLPDQYTLPENSTCLKRIAAGIIATFK